MENNFSQNLKPDLNPELPITHSNNSNTFKLVIAALVLLIPVAGVGGYYLGLSNQKANNVSKVPIIMASPVVGEGVACTMDAKICPDGSSVGRTGPNCEFSDCPDEVSVNTFTSSVMGFTLTYPNDWNLGGLNPGSISSEVSEHSKGVNLSPKTGGPMSLSIEIESPSNLQRRTFAEWSENIKSSQIFQIQKESTVVLGGRQATKIEGISENSGGIPTYNEVYITQNGENYMYVGVTDLTSRPNQQVVGQILDSLKFK